MSEEGRIVLWDRKGNKPGEPISSIPRDKIVSVEQRFWGPAGGPKVEGSVVKMVEGHDPPEYGLANQVAQARRILGVISKPLADREPDIPVIPQKGR